MSKTSLLHRMRRQGVQLSAVFSVLALFATGSAAAETCERAVDIENGARICDPPRSFVRLPSGAFQIHQDLKTYYVKITHECEQVFSTRLDGGAYRDSGLNRLKGDFATLERTQKLGRADVRIVDTDDVRNTFGVAFGMIDGRRIVLYATEFAGGSCAVRADLTTRAQFPEQEAANVLMSVLSGFHSPDAQLSEVVREAGQL